MLSTRPSFLYNHNPMDFKFKYFRYYFYIFCYFFICFHLFIYFFVLKMWLKEIIEVKKENLKKK